MAHLAVSDRGRTVLMIQVENEIGMIPDPRDRSPLARAAGAKPVPPGLPGAGKSWAEAYGAGADEAFMANAYARYTGRLAAPLKRSYPLPMYVKAALPRPNAAPGRAYPPPRPVQQLPPLTPIVPPSPSSLAPPPSFPTLLP